MGELDMIEDLTCPNHSVFVQATEQRTSADKNRMHSDIATLGLIDDKIDKYWTPHASER